MERSLRAYAWVHFFSTSPSRTRSAKVAANEADEALKLLDDRFQDCEACEGRGRSNGTICTHCLGRGTKA